MLSIRKEFIYYLKNSNRDFLAIGKEAFESGELSAKDYLTLCYLRLHCNRSGQICITVKGICEGIGYSAKSGKASMPNQIRNTLFGLLLEEALYYKEDDRRANNTLNITLDLEHEIFIPVGSFVKIYSDEFAKITESDYRYKDKMLAVLIAVKIHINTSGYCYCSEKTIENTASIACSITHNTVNAILDKLTDNGIIACYKIGSYIDADGKLRRFPNFYGEMGQQMDKQEIISIAKGIIRRKHITIDSFIPVRDGIQDKELLDGLFGNGDCIPSARPPPKLRRNGLCNCWPLV